MSIILEVSEIILFASAGISPFYFLWRKLNFTNRIDFLPPDDSENALRLQKIHGYNEHSLVGITGEKSFWLDQKKQSAISYNERGKIWIVAGEPLAVEKDLLRVMQEFLDYARTKKKIVAFLPITERFARLIDSTDFNIVKIGASPYFDLQNWNPRGNKAKHLRVALNHSKRAGISVSEVSEITEEFRCETSKLSQDWLNSRRARIKFGWLFALGIFDKSDCKKFFAARNQSGKLVGILAASPIPARDGWYLEDVLRANDAPQGTADLLIFETLKILASQGAKLATLGTVPLSDKGLDYLQSDNNRFVKNSLKFSRKNFNSIYNFEGLQRFKSKFVPTWWESEYAVCHHKWFSILRIVCALFYVIIPGGLAEVIQTNLQNYFNKFRRCDV